MASTKILLSATAVILVVSVFVPQVMGIKCFQCNSFEDKACEFISPTNNTQYTRYLKECDSSLSGDRPMFCRKIVQHITAFESDHSRVIRKCSYEPSEKECYHFEDEDHSELACQCFEDGCNGAHRSGPLWRITLPTITVSLASYISANKL